MSAAGTLAAPAIPPSCDAQISLPEDEIHLWLTDYEDRAADGLTSRYRELLSDAERAQEPRFWFERDSRRYLITRALVRVVLSRYASLRPERWAFVTNAFGRPQVAPGLIGERWISFNLSHTHSLIALSVARRRAIGVDVENWPARTVSLDLARRQFSADEATALAAVPRDDQQYRFFEYWTFKESYIKARGMGLSLPLDKFGFRFPHPGAAELRVDPSLHDDAMHWHLWQLRPAPEYLLALCARRIGTRAPKVIVRTTIPLLYEEPFACETVRAEIARAS